MARKDFSFFLINEADQIDTEQAFVFFSEEESGHLSRVCRARAGDAVSVTDGRGHVYRATLLDLIGRRWTARIEDSTYVAPSSVRLELCFGLLRSRATDTVLEKATELGVDCFRPVLCRNSIAVPGNPDALREKRARWERVVKSAVKQSMRSWMPEVHPAVKLEKLLAEASGAGRMILADRGGVHVTGLAGEMKCEDKCTILLFTGPEAGFSPDEVRSIEKLGARRLCLGWNRLRAETAALFAVGLVRQFLDPGSAHR